MPPTRPGDPRRVGPYRVLGRLGAGGMGQVLLGRSPGGRTVAIKIIHPALADEPDFRSRFRREVTAARAVDGAYTAPVVDADPDAAQPWLATAYLPGLSLQDAVAGHGPLPPPAARALGAGLAEALLSIHRAGVVHRDLKPSNVMLTPEGPRVIDFGIARAIDASALTRTGTTLGTPAYMAPEQAAGETAGPAADVFSLGAVLTYALTGSGPFGHGAVHEVVYRVLHRQPDLGAITDPALRVLIASCLEKDPARRPGPGEVLRALAGDQAAPPDGTRWLPAAVAHAVAGRGTEPAAPGPGRRRFLAIGAGTAGALLTSGSAAAFLLGRGDDSPLRWTFALPGDLTVRVGPLVAPGVLLIVGAQRLDTTTYAVDPRTGERRWQGDFGASRDSRLAVLGGTGFLCDAGGSSSALTGFDLATGRRLWSASLRMFTMAPAPFAGAGVFCVPGSEGIGSDGLFAFDAATGRRRWHYRTERVMGDAVPAGGLCYLTDESGFLYAVDMATGAARWQQRVAERLGAVTPAVGGGLVAVLAPDRRVHAFDAATGEPRWRSQPAEGASRTGGLPGEPPPLLAGGTVYVGGAGGVLTVLDARSGGRRWQYGGGSDAAPPGGEEHPLPAVGGGLAVLDDGDGTLAAMDAATGRVRWRRPLPQGFGERPVIAGNVVYLAMVDGVHGFDLATGRPRYRLGGDDVPEDSTASAQGLTADGPDLYCSVGGKLLCALRPSSGG
ncbi:PQQ-binding-like beta-propeller repeat protein [Spirillospora sp. CA-255316]